MSEKEALIAVYDFLDKSEPESSYLEYKKSTQQKDKIIKVACAFANNIMNNDASYLIFGVQEQNEVDGSKAVPKKPIYGINPKFLETERNKIKNLLTNIHPRINYLLVTLSYKKSLVIAVVIPRHQNENGPYITSDLAQKDKSINLPAKVYVRYDTDSKTCTPEQFQELTWKFSRLTFLSQSNATAKVSDLNILLILEYLRRIHPGRVFEKTKLFQLVKELKLSNEKNLTEKSRITNFAVLMFTDKPKKFIPGAYTALMIYDKVKDGYNDRILDGNLLKQIDDLNDFFSSNIEKLSENVEDNFATKGIYNYPLSVLRELAVNALYHKDYARNENVRIFWNEDSVVFFNPNKPLLPVTLDKLNTSRDIYSSATYRNPELKESLKLLNFVETHGAGVAKAKKALEKNSSPQLLFDIQGDGDANFTQVTVKIHPYAQTKHTKEINLNKSTTENISNLSNLERFKLFPAQIEILKLIQGDKNIKMSEIAKKINLSVAGVKYHMQILKSLNLVKFTGNTKAGFWELIEETIANKK
ncbi:RNA-binding domain-containing protein [Mycoplasmopsis columbinasalis]|uniref:Divergent AAA domain n=1 Tax=Mycoplasmopsis columbinasalis TaxID=114880 RepID=A0A449BA94_9BACT|nr:RNA-binding domain-containing protein [Mycoplasmopsis columbinasalis]VEU78114.1 Divergent AAA domain [Mycoplasmopsis columbinasalis]